MPRSKENRTVGRRGLFWFGAFLVIAVWTFWRLGGFDLWATITTVDGATLRFPNTFATVDHPFHATRAETLRRSLADGQLLRWIGNHQGGYPVEFYPLGAAWMEVIVWALTLGFWPVMAVHKLVVIGVYLLPAVGFAALARYGRLPWSIPVLAIAMHLAVRGWWWSGGYTELVEWGLLTNVASAALLPLVLAVHRGYLRNGYGWQLAAGSVVASIALYTNVRSVLPLAAILAGCGLAAIIEQRSRESAGWVVRRSASMVGLTVLLAAPLVVALVRFSDLYVFVRYSSYADLGDYWQSSVQAVSAPVMVLAAAGAAMALLAGKDDGARTVLIVLALYVGGTALAVVSNAAAELVSQLEATRLMPFQRLLVMYLAAYGVWSMADRLQNWVRHPERSEGSPAAAALGETGALAANGEILHFVQNDGGVGRENDGEAARGNDCGALRGYPAAAVPRSALALADIGVLATDGVWSMTDHLLRWIRHPERSEGSPAAAVPGETGALAANGEILHFVQNDGGVGGANDGEAARVNGRGALRGYPAAAVPRSELALAANGVLAMDGVRSMTDHLLRWKRHPERSEGSPASAVPGETRALAASGEILHFVQNDGGVGGEHNGEAARVNDCGAGRGYPAAAVPRGALALAANGVLAIDGVWSITDHLLRWIRHPERSEGSPAAAVPGETGALAGRVNAANGVRSVTDHLLRWKRHPERSEGSPASAVPGETRALSANGEILHAVQNDGGVGGENDRGANGGSNGGTNGGNDSGVVGGSDGGAPEENDRGEDRVSSAPSGFLMDTIMAVAVLLFLGGYVGGWLPGIPESDRATGPIVTTGTTAIAELRDQIELADQSAEPGTAILVLGTTVSWHDQLWSPQWSDRRFFYDDWLWYWQTDHYGVYDPLTSHAYDDDASTIDAGYFSQHGIGAVVVTGEAAASAASSPLLQLLRAGQWSTYLVREPDPLVTVGGDPALDVTATDKRITGTANEPSSDFAIHHNWYPRWSATVDESPAKVEKDDRGYMFVTSDEPGTGVVVSYGTDVWDWIARTALCIGLAVVAVQILPVRRHAINSAPSQELARQ